ncbi:MAG: endonuclease [Erysipelotrichaceae bacterium]|jgi:uncharacterized protein YjdB|nr:endonuclease [Erysipelotrichaceae bacterium]
MKLNKYFYITFIGTLIIAAAAGIKPSTDNLLKAAGPTQASSLPTTIDTNDYTISDIRSYYSSLTSLSASERKGTNLLKNLKPILSADTKYFSYSQVWSTANITDRNWDISKASNISAANGTYNSTTKIISNYVYYNGTSGDDPSLHVLYRNDNDSGSVKASNSHTDIYNALNREHIWPQSRGFKTDGSGATGPAGTDIHHLVIADARVNMQHHNNYAYGDVTGAITFQESGNGIDDNLRGKNAALGTDDIFEPQDSDKGDIARACFYMAARYNNWAGTKGAITAFEPFLILNDDISTSGSAISSSDSTPASYASLSTLLEWNKLDPVDDYEIHRNNLIHRNFQNNRNPFVDFPEWADYVWGASNTTSADPNNDLCTTRIKVTGISLSSSSVSLTTGQKSTLSATIAPSNATIKDIIWSTSNSAVVSISSTSGSSINITGVSSGSATITATTKDGEFIASSNITVSGSGENIPDPALEGEITDTFMAKGFGGNTESGYTTSGVDYTEQKGTTNINYAMCVFVGSNGQLRGNKNNVSGNFSLRNLSTYSNYYISKISITVSSGTLRSDNTGRSVASFANTELDPTVAGSVIADQGKMSGQNTLSWSVANPLESKYTYFLINNLQTDQSAYSNIEDSIQITWVCEPSDNPPVSEKVLSSIEITNLPNKVSYTVGETLDFTGLTVSAIYSDDTRSAVSEYTTNLSAGTVLNTAGTEEIVVTYQLNGISKTASFNISVSEAIIELVGVNVTTSKNVLIIGETTQLVVTINPTVTNPATTITYYSSDISIASVNSNGLVTALSIGSTTIYITATQNGKSKTAECLITVEEEVFTPTTTYSGSATTTTTATLITDLSTLKAGDKFIIADTSSSVALGSQNGNIRNSVSITIEGNNITDIGGASILTLEGSVGAWNIVDETGSLLQVNVSSSNYLRNGGTASDLTAQWTITAGEGNEVLITNLNYTTKRIQYNSGFPRFSTYTGTQQDPSLYLVSESTSGEVLYNYNYLVDAFDGGANSWCDLNLEGLNTLKDRYDAMTSIEKEHFDTLSISGTTGFLAYSEAMAKRARLLSSETSSKFNINLDEDNIVILAFIALGVSLFSIITFAYLKRKNA